MRDTMDKKQVKSKQRVAEHGEVFTANREVNAMLDLVKQETQRVDSRFLDKIKRQIADLPDIVRGDEAYQNAMRYSDAQNARDESDRAVFEAIMKTMSSGMELYTAFQDDMRNSNNQSFKKWLLDMVFNSTYRPGGASAHPQA